MRTLLCVAALCATLSASPAITKVEPPDWWVGHSINPVRLLITGKDLSGANLSAPSGMSVTNIRTSTAGRYLFADLTIPAGMRPDEYALTLTTPTGTATVPFRVNPPLPGK